MQPLNPQPFATWNPASGAWETTQLDLSGLPAPFSETWPISGMTRNGSAYPLPLSAFHTPGFAYSSSRTPLFRTPLASDAARGGENLDQVKARRGTIALSHQIIDIALNGPAGSEEWKPEPETLWWLIDGILGDGADTPTPSPTGNTSPEGKPRRRRS